MRIFIAAVTLGLLAGCAKDDGTDFSPGGSDYDYNGGVDDAMSGTTEAEEGAPTITGFSVALDEFPSGFVLELTIEYSDDEGDVYDDAAGEGGTLYLSVSEDGAEAQEFGLEVGSSDAPVDPSSGAIVPVLSDVDDSIEYVITASLEDLAGNTSPESESSYTPN